HGQPLGARPAPRRTADRGRRHPRDGVRGRCRGGRRGGGIAPPPWRAAMSTKKSLDKVIGWFVERDPEDAAVEEEPDRAPGSGDRAVVSADPPREVRAPAPSTTTGEGGFVDIYRAAGVPAEEQDRAERALGLLRTLPPGVPIDARRAIVTASLAAF